MEPGSIEASGEPADQPVGAAEEQAAGELSVAAHPDGRGSAAIVVRRSDWAPSRHRRRMTVELDGRIAAGLRRDGEITLPVQPGPHRVRGWLGWLPGEVVVTEAAVGGTVAVGLAEPVRPRGLVGGFPVRWSSSPYVTTVRFLLWLAGIATLSGSVGADGMRKWLGLAAGLLLLLGAMVGWPAPGRRDRGFDDHTPAARLIRTGMLVQIVGFYIAAFAFDTWVDGDDAFAPAVPVAFGVAAGLLVAGYLLRRPPVRRPDRP